MASVTESFESRSSDSRGLSGPTASRTFVVTNDTNTDDPIQTLIESKDVGNHRVGEFHPDPNYPIMVRFHKKGHRITDLSWLVDAIYGPPNAESLFGSTDAPGWQIRMAAITEQEQITHSLTPIEAPKIIGVPEYEPINGTESDYYYDPVGDNNPADWVYLVRKGGVKARPQTALRAKSAISLVREFATFTQIWVSPVFLNAAIGRVNSATWLGLPKGTVKFTNWNVDVTPGSTVSGDSTNGYVFRVQLDFEMDFTQITDILPESDRTGKSIVGHSPLQLAHIWQDAKKGVDYPIFDKTVTAPGADKRALENFDVANFLDISAFVSYIVNIFGG